MKPTLSNVILNWNRLDLLQKCVDSYIATVSVPRDLFVIDNNSTDGSREFIQEFCRSHKNRKVVLLRENQTVVLQKVNGEFGSLPGDSESAVRELERLRSEGAKFLSITWPAFWWLDHYRGLRKHLYEKHKCLEENERLIAFSL